MNIIDPLAMHLEYLKSFLQDHLILPSAYFQRTLWYTFFNTNFLFIFYVLKNVLNDPHCTKTRFSDQWPKLACSICVIVYWDSFSSWIIDFRSIYLLDYIYIYIYVFITSLAHALAISQFLSALSTRTLIIARKLQYHGEEPAISVVSKNSMTQF